MTLELTERNWCVEIAALKDQGKITPFTAQHMIDIIHTGGKRGIPMSDKDFSKLTDEVFTVKFTDTRHKGILVYRGDRAYLSKTEW